MIIPRRRNADVLGRWKLDSEFTGPMNFPAVRDRAEVDLASLLEHSASGGGAGVLLLDSPPEVCACTDIA
jgi:hypothetical protein